LTGSPLLEFFLHPKPVHEHVDDNVYVYVLVDVDGLYYYDLEQIYRERMAFMILPVSKQTAKAR
jgi:hypothetical protein